MEEEEIVIKILGNELRIKGNKSYIYELSQYVDDKIQDIDRSTGLGSSTKIALYAAFQIADELFKAQQNKGSVKEKHSKKIDRLLEKLQKGLQEKC